MARFLGEKFPFFFADTIDFVTLRKIIVYQETK